MARVTLSALITSIAGRYGGGVFRAWKGLTVLGVLPSTVHNPNSVKQVKVRELLAYLSKQWTILTFLVKDEWDAVAAYLTDQWGNYTNEVGSHIVIRTPRGPYTGLDALVACHSLLGGCSLYSTGQPLISAPVGVGAPTCPIDVAAVGDTDGIIVTWLDPLSWGPNGTIGKVRVWAKSEDGTFFAQFVACVAAATLTFTITDMVPVGGATPVQIRPGPYFIQMDAINVEGLRSAPSAVVRTIIVQAP
jgi:hypothetical protein